MCEVCKVPKVEYVHHCRKCGRCVYMMDHHCMWIDNCIGENTINFYFRLQYLVILASGAMSVFWIMIILFSGEPLQPLGLCGWKAFIPLAPLFVEEINFFWFCYDAFIFLNCAFYCVYSYGSMSLVYHNILTNTWEPYRLKVKAGEAKQRKPRSKEETEKIIWGELGRRPPLWQFCFDRSKPKWIY